MDEYEIQLARTSFRARIGSLRNDVARCFWPITTPTVPVDAPAPAVICNPPQYAPFPAAMYCFATADYFSSFWEGWNDSKNAPSGRNQNKRIMDFLCRYLLYPKKEAYLAIAFWRHKLMHTSEPRKLKSKETPPKTYVWWCGIGVSPHMRLQQPDDKKEEYVLGFDFNVFIRDLDEGVFGPRGYFTALANELDLQANYVKCFNEMEQYEIDFAKGGL